MAFLQGLALSQQFFQEAAKPILDKFFPKLQYTAGLLGYGSDVLGYDDPVSTDHMWGPRFYLFLEEEALELRPAMEKAFAQNLPYTFAGYSVHFSPPDPLDNGVRHAQFIQEGEVSPLIFIHSIPEFFTRYLGTCQPSSLTCAQWLAISEHRLLAAVSGKLFRDDLHLKQLQKEFSFYPDPVWHYLLASQWSLIAEEQAFVKRCSQTGDDLGSRILAARMAERIMRLCFLYERQYAPYSKWFGTAFSRLNISSPLKEQLAIALSTSDPLEREQALVSAQQFTAQLHNAKGITSPIQVAPHSYFSRDILVLSPELFAQALSQLLQGTELEHVPLIGSLSQIGNFCAISDSPACQKRITPLYAN